MIDERLHLMLLHIHHDITDALDLTQELVLLEEMNYGKVCLVNLQRGY